VRVSKCAADARSDDGTDAPNKRHNRESAS
jgi:hypothetical protein